MFVCVCVGIVGIEVGVVLGVFDVLSMVLVLLSTSCSIQQRLFIFGAIGVPRLHPLATFRASVAFNL